MSAVKFRDPATGQWLPLTGLKVVMTHPGIPGDIAREADRAAYAIKGKMAPNSVNFIAMADMHEMGDQDSVSEAVLRQYRRANRNAGQGALLAAEVMKPHFFANLGDLAWGYSSTTAHGLAQSIVGARCCTAALEPLTECIFVPGNHDGGNLDEDLTAGMTGSYRYLDLAEQKVRVICLNTADSTGSSEGLSGAQLQWFAETLDLSEKGDPARWSILVLSHHPLDWGNVKPAADCLGAYLRGEQYTATHGGVSVSKDFADKNAAEFIANFHGHTHCFKVGGISGTEVLRVAIPNACFGRENEYGKSGNLEYGEITSYPKQDDGTGKNTAFCLVSVDLEEKIIYADCFGAGYDRVIRYGGGISGSYTVTNNLNCATTSNNAVSVAAGAGYSAVITPGSGYVLTGIAVTMGGVDITASAVTGSSIRIACVTGDLVITASVKANEVSAVTNLVPTSEAADSTAPYNGKGYKNGAYLSSGGGDGEDSACVATGYIPYAWEKGNEIYVKGAMVSNASHIRIYGYMEKGTLTGSATCSGPTMSSHFVVEELESGTYYKLTTLNNVPEARYLRLSLIGTGENLIVTLNEPIN